MSAPLTEAELAIIAERYASPLWWLITRRQMRDDTTRLLGLVEALKAEAGARDDNHERNAR